MHKEFMKLKNQVCRLAQGKYLKLLGCTKPSLFYWIDNGTNNVCIMNAPVKDGKDLWPKISAPAYTVAELGELLPTGYDTMRVNENGTEYWRGYDDSGADYPADILHETEAQARAAMLIQLLENKLYQRHEKNNL